MNISNVSGTLAMKYQYGALQGTDKSEKTDKSFSEQIEKSVTKKSYTSATEDYKKRHPESASRVDSQIRAGKNVIKKNGAENVSRDDMTMEEYKRFFTGLMQSIPYDWSQKNDVNVWSITEAGWEQMRNDPDYEAWVLGYTAQDRAVNIPFAAMPGYFPSYHTEHFGASIDEHLGQGIPMNNPAVNKEADDGKSWWEKRHERMEKLLEEIVETATEKEAVKKAQAKGAAAAYEENISRFSKSVVGNQKI